MHILVDSAGIEPASEMPPVDTNYSNLVGGGFGSPLRSICRSTLMRSQVSYSYATGHYGCKSFPYCSANKLVENTGCGNIFYHDLL